MRTRITKNVATVIITMAMMLMGTMSISADNTEFKLVKVVSDGYSISANKGTEAVLLSTYKHQDLFLNVTEGDWAKVTTSDGSVTGYIPAAALAEKVEEAQVTRSAVSKSNGDAIVALAKTKLGAPYVYGASGPYSFDCSGFTSYVYRQFGVSLPRTSSSQGTVGKAVSYSEAKPGDLIAYSGHVAIYVGNGKMIHSPRPGQSVRIDSVYSVGPVRSVRRLV